MFSRSNLKSNYNLKLLFSPSELLLILPSLAAVNSRNNDKFKIKEKSLPVLVVGSKCDKKKQGTVINSPYLLYKSTC